MNGDDPESQKINQGSFETNGSLLTIPQAQLLLEQARLEGNAENVCANLIRLAHLHFRQGRYQQTRLFAMGVLRDAPSTSSTRCDAYRLLGNCAAELGDPNDAEAYYQQSIDLARQLDNRYTLFKCLHSLATNIYWPGGQFDLCLAAGKEALAQAKALDLGEEVWFPLSDIGWAYWSTGQRALALQIADQMRSVVSPGSLGDGFTCCLRAGQMEASPDYLSRVLPLYERARSIAEACGDPGLNLEVRIGLCRSFRQAQDDSTSLLWAEDAVAVSTRMNYCQFQGIALIERGRTFIEQGNFASAEVDLRKALELSLKMRANFDRTRAMLYLAVVLSATDSPQAGSFWLDAIRLIKDYGYGFLVDQERTLLLPWIAKMHSNRDPIMENTSATILEQLMSQPPSSLSIKTLGNFSLRIGPNPVKKANLRQRCAGELLVLLLSSHGFTLSADQVGEAMCREKDIYAATDFYHHAISALRHLLEPDLPGRRFPCRYLDVSEDRVTLILPPGSTIDFIEFRQRILAKEWQQALELYQGEFMPMDRYVEWTIPIRLQLSEQYDTALIKMAEECLDSGDAAACLGFARRALEHNSWQEHAVELGMRAALASGDRVTAVRLYRQLEKELESELGIEPQTELQQLFFGIRNKKSG